MRWAESGRWETCRSKGRATAQEAGYLPIAQTENCAKLLLCAEFEARLMRSVQGRSEIFQNIFALPLDLL
jgi:hypothetical protein